MPQMPLGRSLLSESNTFRLLSGHEQTSRQPDQPQLWQLQIPSKYNLISALHSFLATRDKKFKNVLPPLILLTEEKQKELIDKLNTLNFTFEKNLAA